MVPPWLIYFMLNTHALTPVSAAQDCGIPHILFNFSQKWNTLLASFISRLAVENNILNKLFPF